ncbi:PhzF family phenazine biosynthesis protein [Alteromonas sp. NFXS44]|uniref:PhzF family phenazine biosynthesis protein n=1 Tax=Alteromonas sp. NFXS44 TaxID=2818435 RepID=UPI0032DE8881
MNIERISAFSNGSSGGNPAGVVLCETMPNPDVMQNLAAQIGYSETAFATPSNKGWRVRYFSPEVEVDFCGHATIALGAVLAKNIGAGEFSLTLNHAEICVEGYFSDDGWGASFVSPPTYSQSLEPNLLQETLTLFGLNKEDLDTRLPPAIAFAGGTHLILILNDRNKLKLMNYDQKQGADLSKRAGLVTFSLIYPESHTVFHSRNPFPTGGVFEDPATGAAAAALGGYLRDINWPHGGSITVHQGDDMGMPSRLNAEIYSDKGSGIRVSGATRKIY